MWDLFSLKGLTTVVTGGSSGIGRAIATALAAAGAAVIITARREGQLQETVEDIRSKGGSACYMVTDLTDVNNASVIANELSKSYGQPNVVVNCAGVNLRQAAMDVSVEDWARTIDLNLSMPFFLSREFVPAMREKKWGRVINIASLQSMRAFPGGIAYGSSKGGVCQLTRAMAVEWSADGICCNAIAPGFFPTELTAPVFQDPEKSAWAAKQTAVGRNGELKDLTGIAVFLASRASDYITGQTIFVDGGFTAK